MCFFSNLIPQSEIDSTKYSSESAKYKAKAHLFQMLNIHTSDFVAPPEFTSCCEKFTGGFGTSTNFGVSLERYILPQITLGAELNYFSAQGIMQPNETILLKLDNQVIDGIFSHRYEFDLNYLNFNTFAKYFINQKFAIKTGIGFLINTSSNFNYREEIVKPEDRGVFLDSQRQIRNLQEGEINSAKTLLPLLFFGASYYFTLNKEQTLFLTPEVNFAFSGGSINREVDWYYDFVQLSLGLTYDFEFIAKKDTIYTREVNRDTIIVESNLYPAKTIRYGIEISNITKSDEAQYFVSTEYVNIIDTIFIPSSPKVEIETNIEKVTINYRFIDEEFPILPVVFFENNSSNLPEEVIISNEYFDEEKFSTEPMDYYYNSLNIIAARMKANPKASITLSGYSNIDFENSDCQLAQNREVAVAKVLTEKYGISKDKIKFKQRKNNKNCYPVNRTQSKSLEANLENSRVEISSNETEILKPVLANRFYEVQSISDSLLEVVDKYGMDTHDSLLIIEIESQVVAYYTEGSQKLKIDISKLIKDKLSSNEISIKMTKINKAGISISDIRTIKVSKDTLVNGIQRLSLILFDVGSYKLSKRSQFLLDGFIERVENNSILNIYGYCDLIGDSEANDNLAFQRAIQTQEYILNKNKDLKVGEVINKGFRQMPRGIKSYDSPAERFMCRTVLIESKVK